MKPWLTLLVLTFHTVGFSQPFPHKQAHAHNDYVHDRPLVEALENGFMSVEADVHLVNGQLLVSHDAPGAEAKTLEALYLKPLDNIRKQNGGWIYPAHHTPLMLMIDIKTNAEETTRQLLKVLEIYDACLATSAHVGAVRIFISGNRCFSCIQQDAYHRAGLDGRPQDIGKQFTVETMPVISEDFKKIMSWDGNGSPPVAHLQNIKILAEKVHAEKKKLRLWGTPDTETTWQVLLDAGVDLINTDKLKELNLYLKRKKI